MSKFFNLRMRASHAGQHISGAEQILPENNLFAHVSALLRRALQHPRGAADEIQITAKLLDEKKIQYLPALPVTKIETKTAEEGLRAIVDILAKLGLTNGEKILEKMSEAYDLRGALLLDADTLERLDNTGGVRASCLDGLSSAPKDKKDHFREALVLATKVAHAPGIIAEICISDDPDYVTGYAASRALGYQRIMTLKNLGDGRGGRIFLYRGSKEKVLDCIDYLQNQPVIVNDLPQKQDKKTLIQKKLDGLRAAGLYRKIPGENKKTSLASNNYLNLAEDERVKNFSAEMTQKYGAGTGASRLTSGNTALHDELEKQLAQWKGTESALLFNTGYMANLGVISALCDKDWVVFSDEKNHASIIDGCRLSGAQVAVFRHKDLADLEEKIQEHSGCSGLIVSDAVFSMEGDIADLPSLLDLAEKYGLYSMIDEAHSGGVLGKTGRGILEHFGLTQKPDILLGTCSKALGSLGGFICAEKLLTEYILNKARSFIFSTALPAGTVAASLKALEILRAEPQRVQKLKENSLFFQKCLREQNIKVNSETAIIPILIGSEEEALRAAENLSAEGFYIPAIRYPTVPRGQAILRASVAYAHTAEELQKASEAIGAIR